VGSEALSGGGVDAMVGICLVLDVWIFHFLFLVQATGHGHLRAALLEADGGRGGAGGRFANQFPPFFEVCRRYISMWIHTDSFIDSI
jgi:hypothetical protein